MSIEEKVVKQIETIENSLESFHEKAAEEIKASGVIATETQNSMDNLGEQQREIADRMLKLEQSSIASPPSTDTEVTNLGKEFTKSQTYENFQNGNSQKARLEILNNTITGSDVTVAPDRKLNIVPGAFQPLTLETLIPSMPTTKDAIEFTRENVFTNLSAETAQAGAKPESSLTFSLVPMPISTVAHWVKISRQLSSDAPALAAYINTRMAYGVDQRVELQLGAGDGISPNISGILNAGNFTAHGFADAALGTVLKKIVLIRKIIADLWIAGYVADAILLNPADWAQVEIDALTVDAGQVPISINAAGQQTLFGVPVIQSIAITADQVAVGAFQQAATIHNREATVVELSESDDTNFTTNLVTVRAERRLALTIDRPAAIIAGDLTPL